VVSPIYVFESGLPQPADLLLLFIGALLFVFRGFQAPAMAKGGLGAVAGFVFYSLIVNGSWYLFLGDATLLIPSAYYAFNGFCFFVALALYDWFGASFFRWTCVAIMCSIAVQLFTALQIWDSSISEAVRATLFFRNPNQTAYYAVLTGTILLLCGRRGHLPVGLRALLPLVFVGLTIITAMTQSRAGLAAVGMLVVLYCARRLVLVVLGIAAVLVAVHTEPVIALREQIAERMESKQKNLQEEMAYRGYARFWEQPQHLWFGAGEGAYERFVALPGKELHSTFGNVLMSYGLVGLGLLCAFYWQIVRFCGWYALIDMLPIWVYGLTHNGIRQSEYWIIPALMICLELERRFPTGISRYVEKR